MKRIAERTEMKHDVPLFDDDAVSEIDQVFDSVAWDLCGRRQVRRQSGPTS
jgi:hypothetical protein